MRQIIKMIKSGQELTFTCSQCGLLIHNMFIPTGKIYEPNWDEVPEICQCGTRLTIRRPIIDTSDVDTSHIDIEYDRNNVHTRKNTFGNKYDANKRRIIDLETAISIDYFNMRLNAIKREGADIPDNIDYLKIECIKRNISHIESNEKYLLCNDGTRDKKYIQERLNILRQQHNELFEKLENRKDDIKDLDVDSVDTIEEYA